MPIAFGERQHPVWDALRVQTLQGMPTSDQLSGAIAVSGLGNKIIVYHSSGSDLELFDPTEAGLIAALAAAASGDTVWLPSISIACTTGVTVPVSVMLIGISDNAVLSFSGFSGAGVTLGANSAVYGFSIAIVATGADAIGVDARATYATVEHMTITASGGSTRNLRVLAGVDTSAAIGYLFSIDSAPLILWAVYNATSLSWHTIAAPTGFTTPQYAAGFSYSLQVDHLGRYLYVNGNDSGNSNRASVWQLDNLAAILANPATSPSWTVIAYAGMSTSAGTLGVSSTDAFYVRSYIGNLHLRSTSNITGSYDGAAWTWKTQSPTNSFETYMAISGTTYADMNGVAGASYLRQISNDAAIGSSFQSKFGINHFSEIWQRVDAINHYHFPLAKTDAHCYIHEQTTATEVDIGTAAGNEQDSTTMRGAHTGDQIYCVDAVGNLWYSTNGLSFSNIATWLNGWVHNTILDGSGNLVWMIEAQIDNNPLVKTYDTSGTLLADITGDLWTVLGHPGGTVSFYNLQPVYTPVSAGSAPIVADLHAGSATGTGAADIEVSGAAYVFDCEFATIQTDSGATVYVRDVSYTTHNGTGTIEPVQSDRGAWDALNYATRHTNDTDAATTALHHTLGTGADQSAAGNHTHAATPSGITAGTYGDATHAPRTTYNTYGVATKAYSVPIDPPPKLDFFQASVNRGGVSRSGATTDNHLAVWNGTSADSIKDGGAVPSGTTGDFLVMQVFS